MHIYNICMEIKYIIFGVKHAGSAAVSAARSKQDIRHIKIAETFQVCGNLFHFSRRTVAQAPFWFQDLVWRKFWFEKIGNFFVFSNIVKLFYRIIAIFIFSNLFLYLSFSNSLLYFFLNIFNLAYNFFSILLKFFWLLIFCSLFYCNSEFRYIYLKQKIFFFF